MDLRSHIWLILAVHQSVLMAENQLAKVSQGNFLNHRDDSDITTAPSAGIVVDLGKTQGLADPKNCVGGPSERIPEAE